MKFSISEQSERVLRKRIRHRQWLTVVGCLALVAATATAVALKVSGTAATYKQQVLQCTYQVHEHTDDCYDEAQEELICGLADYVVHTHNEDCYDAGGALVCTLPEIEEHTHDASCYKDETVLACGHSESAGHVHSDSCYAPAPDVLTCGMEEHVHGDGCYNNNPETGVSTLVCDLKSHTHTDDCYTPSEGVYLACGMEEGDGAHWHTDACYETREVLSCGKLENHTHDEDCYDEYDNLICTETVLEEHVHTAECFETVELTAEEIAAMNAGLAAAAAAEAADGASDEMASEEPDDGYIKQTFTGDDFTVTVKYTEEAEIPAEAQLFVSELLPESEEYAAYAAQAMEAMGVEDESLITGRLFDISFLLNGAEVEPAAAVDVTVAYADGVEQNLFITPRVVHFAGDEEAQLVDVQTADGDYSFSTDSFSYFWVGTETAGEISLTIEDHIAENGTLEAVLTVGGQQILPSDAGAGASYTVIWYKRAAGAEEYTKVEPRIVGVLNDENQWNVTQSGRLLNVALDGGARCTYYAEVTIGTTTETTDEFTVNYYTELQNGDFSHNAENWTVTVTDVSFTDEYAMLNKNGAVSQTVLTKPGDTLRWNLDHQTPGVDDNNEKEYSEMFVVIMSEKAAEQYNTSAKLAQLLTNSHAESLRGKLKEGYEGTGILNFTSEVLCKPGNKTKQITVTVDGKQEVIYVARLITRENGNWHLHHGSYTVPEGQCLTRIFFVGGNTTKYSSNTESATTSASWLDNVSFGYDMPQTATPDVALVTIQLEIAGLNGSNADKALLNGLKFAINNTMSETESYTGSSFNWNYDVAKKTWIGTTVYKYKGSKSGNLDFTITESTVNIEGFTRQNPTITVDADRKTITGAGTAKQSAKVTVEYCGTDVKKQQAAITITSTYVPNRALTLKKTNDNTENPETLQGAKFTITPMSGEVYRLETNSIGEAVVLAPTAEKGLLYNTIYTLTETEAPEGYNMLTDSIYFLVSNTGTVYFYDDIFDEEAYSIGDNGVLYTKENGVKTPMSGREADSLPVKAALDNSGNVVLTVVNTTSYEIPHTGGQGTAIYTLAGAGLILLGFTYSAILLRKKKGVCGE